MDTEYDYLFKCVTIGDSGVGKTQFVNLISNKPYNSEYRNTIGVEFTNKIVNVQNKNVKLQLWDTAGQERYRAITCAYYRGSVLTFLVFDISNRNSFENLHKWISETNSHSDQCSFTVLIGNKSDLNKLVLQEEIDNFVDENNCHIYYELSCKTQSNVINDILNDVAEELLARETSKYLTNTKKPKQTTTITNELSDTKFESKLENLTNELSDIKFKLTIFRWYVFCTLIAIIYFCFFRN